MNSKLFGCFQRLAAQSRCLIAAWPQHNWNKTEKEILILGQIISSRDKGTEQWRAVVWQVINSQKRERWFFVSRQILRRTFILRASLCGGKRRRRQHKWFNEWQRWIKVASLKLHRQKISDKDSKVMNTRGKGNSNKWIRWERWVATSLSISFRRSKTFNVAF